MKIDKTLPIEVLEQIEKLNSEINSGNFQLIE